MVSDDRFAIEKLKSNASESEAFCRLETSGSVLENVRRDPATGNLLWFNDKSKSYEPFNMTIRISIFMPASASDKSSLSKHENKHADAYAAWGNEVNSIIKNLNMNHRSGSGANAYLQTAYAGKLKEAQNRVDWRNARVDGAVGIFRVLFNRLVSP